MSGGRRRLREWPRGWSLSRTLQRFQFVLYSKVTESPYYTVTSLLVSRFFFSGSVFFCVCVSGVECRAFAVGWFSVFVFLCLGLGHLSGPCLPF